jgi:thymidine phosphorylase
MGGGRTRADDRIDRGVGFQAVAKIGSKVARGETIGSVYCRSDAQAERARQKIGEAFTLADEAAAPPPLIGAMIGDRAERDIRLPQG